MTSDSWPNGVATESDNCKFLNLLFANAPRKDLTKFLPTWRWDDASGIFKSCFLTFVRGIHDVNDLKMIEVSFNIFQDQQKWEAQNGHMFQVADRIHDVQGSRKATRYILSPGNPQWQQLRLPDQLWRGRQVEKSHMPKGSQCPSPWPNVRKLFDEEYEEES